MPIKNLCGRMDFETCYLIFHQQILIHGFITRLFTKFIELKGVETKC